jgi:hypothetical protein
MCGELTWLSETGVGASRVGVVEASRAASATDTGVQSRAPASSAATAKSRTMSSPPGDRDPAPTHDRARARAARWAALRGRPARRQRTRDQHADPVRGGGHSDCLMICARCSHTVVIQPQINSIRVCLSSDARKSARSAVTSESARVRRACESRARRRLCFVGPLVPQEQHPDDRLDESPSSAGSRAHHRDRGAWEALSPRARDRA